MYLLALPLFSYLSATNIMPLLLSPSYHALTARVMSKVSHPAVRHSTSFVSRYAESYAVLKFIEPLVQLPVIRCAFMRYLVPFMPTRLLPLLSQFPY